MRTSSSWSSSIYPNLSELVGWALLASRDLDWTGGLPFPVLTFMHAIPSFLVPPHAIGKYAAGRARQARRRTAPYNPCVGLGRLGHRIAQLYHINASVGGSRRTNGWTIFCGVRQ